MEKYILVYSMSKEGNFLHFIENPTVSLDFKSNM